MNSMKQQELFQQTAIAASTKQGKLAIFSCPICKGKATAFKSLISGQVMGHCNSCHCTTITQCSEQ